MYEALKSKIEAIAESYANLVDGRIRYAAKNELYDGTAMTEINDGIRMLNHIAATLERIDRLHHGNDASGSNNTATITERVFSPIVEVSQPSTTEENNFSFFVDDETQTITISPIKEKNNLIRLNKKAARVLEEFIHYQIPKWK